VWRPASRPSPVMLRMKPSPAKRTAVRGKFRLIQ
jgi:hypothetical protein